MMKTFLMIAAYGVVSANSSLAQVQPGDSFSNLKASFGHRLVWSSPLNAYTLLRNRIGPFRLFTRLGLDKTRSRVDTVEAIADGHSTCHRLEKYAFRSFGKTVDQDLISRHVSYTWLNPSGPGLINLTEYLDDRTPSCWLTYSLRRS